MSTEARASEWFVAREPRAILVAKNYRTRRGELDLVFALNGGLVFVEVRARDSEGWVDGVSSVTPAKLRSLRYAIQHFMLRYKETVQHVRLDILAWDGSRWEHLTNVW